MIVVAVISSRSLIRRCDVSWRCIHALGPLVPCCGAPISELDHRRRCFRAGILVREACVFSQNKKVENSEILLSLTYFINFNFNSL